MDTKLKEAAKLIGKRLGIELPGLEAEAKQAYAEATRLKAEMQAAEKTMLAKQALANMKRTRKEVASALVKVIDLGLMDVLLGQRQPTDAEIKTLVKQGLVYSYRRSNPTAKWDLMCKGEDVVSMYRELLNGQ